MTANARFCPNFFPKTDTPQNRQSFHCSSCAMLRRHLNNGWALLFALLCFIWLRSVLFIADSYFSYLERRRKVLHVWTFRIGTVSGAQPHPRSSGRYPSSRGADDVVSGRQWRSGRRAAVCRRPGATSSALSAIYPRHGQVSADRGHATSPTYDDWPWRRRRRRRNWNCRSDGTRCRLIRYFLDIVA